MSYITQLRDANEENIFPVTVDDAVRDLSGNTLSSRLENMDENLSSYNVSVNNGGAAFNLTTAIAAVPDKYHRGGLKLTFISDTTGRYEEWLNTASGWTADTTMWQGVDDTPIINSENLVKSDGIRKSIDVVIDKTPYRYLGTDGKKTVVDSDVKLKKGITVTYSVGYFHENINCSWSCFAAAIKIKKAALIIRPSAFCIIPLPLIFLLSFVT